MRSNQLSYETVSLRTNNGISISFFFSLVNLFFDEIFSFSKFSCPTAFLLSFRAKKVRKSSVKRLCYLQKCIIIILWRAGATRDGLSGIGSFPHAQETQKFFREVFAWTIPRKRKSLPRPPPGAAHPGARSFRNPTRTICAPLQSRLTFSYASSRRCSSRLPFITSPITTTLRRAASRASRPFSPPSPNPNSEK